MRGVNCLGNILGHFGINMLDFTTNKFCIALKSITPDDVRKLGTKESAKVMAAPSFGCSFLSEIYSDQPETRYALRKVIEQVSEMRVHDAPAH